MRDIETIEDALSKVSCTTYTDFGNDPEDDYYPMDIDVFKDDDKNILILRDAIAELKELREKYASLIKDKNRYWELKHDRETYEDEALMKELSVLSNKLFHKDYTNEYFGNKE